MWAAYRDACTSSEHFGQKDGVIGLASVPAAHRVVVPPVIVEPRSGKSDLKYERAPPMHATELRLEGRHDQPSAIRRSGLGSHRRSGVPPLDDGAGCRSGDRVDDPCHGRRAGTVCPLPIGGRAFWAHAAAMAVRRNGAHGTDLQMRRRTLDRSGPRWRWRAGSA